jgi:hypothetical protein
VRLLAVPQGLDEALEAVGLGQTSEHPRRRPIREVLHGRPDEHGATVAHDADIVAIAPQPPPDAYVT